MHLHMPLLASSVHYLYNALRNIIIIIFIYFILFFFFFFFYFIKDIEFIMYRYTNIQQ